MSRLRYLTRDEKSKSFISTTFSISDNLIDVFVFYHNSVIVQSVPRYPSLSFYYGSKTSSQSLPKSLPNKISTWNILLILKYFFFLYKKTTAILEVISIIKISTGVRWIVGHKKFVSGTSGSKRDFWSLRWFSRYGFPFLSIFLSNFWLISTISGW